MKVHLEPRRDPWWQVGLDILVPPRCVGCGRRGAEVCARCRSALRPLGPEICPRCSVPSRGGKVCPRCLDAPRPLHALLAGYRFEGTIRAAIHAFKYRGQRRLDHFLAEALVAPLRTRPLSVDLVTPVPLSERRLRQRGFNQSEALARLCALAGGWPLDTGLLLRVRDTPPQVQLAASARRANVDGAFVVAHADVVAGRRVLLIDDVCTTGATLEACARPLLEAGAAGVWGLVVARATARQVASEPAPGDDAP